MAEDTPNPGGYVQEPKPGEVLAGRYRLGQIVGRGGFGIVYEAMHLEVGRKVALKILLPEFAAQDPELAIRFRREALMASELRHPNTITLYDYGECDNGILYMAMEFIDGRTLSTVLRNEAPISGERVIHIFRQILRSLAEAHSRGIVHRDLKPGNVMLTHHRGDDEYVKVLDFGIAKAVAGHLLDVADVAQTLTQAGRFCGTPRYMAPEQFRNGQVTPSCDLYSLGLIGYELLTGKPAVTGQNMVDIIVAQVTDRELTIPESVAIPAALRTALGRALRKDPVERYTTAAEFAADLDACWEHEYGGRLSGPIDASELAAETTIQMSDAAKFARAMSQAEAQQRGAHRRTEKIPPVERQTTPIPTAHPATEPAPQAPAPTSGPPEASGSQQASLGDLVDVDLADTEVTVEISDLAAFARSINQDIKQPETVPPTRPGPSQPSAVSTHPMPTMDATIDTGAPETVEIAPLSRRGPSKALLIIPLIVILLAVLAILVAALMKTQGLSVSDLANPLAGAEESSAVRVDIVPNPRDSIVSVNHVRKRGRTTVAGKKGQSFRVSVQRAGYVSKTRQVTLGASARRVKIVLERRP